MKKNLKLYIAVLLVVLFVCAGIWISGTVKTESLAEAWGLEEKYDDIGMVRLRFYGEPKDTFVDLRAPEELERFKSVLRESETKTYGKIPEVEAFGEIQVFINPGTGLEFCCSMRGNCLTDMYAVEPGFFLEPGDIDSYWVAEDAPFWTLIEEYRP